jgi:copper chaperone
MKKILLLLLALISVACDDKKDNNSLSQASGQSVKQVTEPIENPSATKTELTVLGMTCGRCVNKIRNVVSALDGVISVSVDLRAQKVTVEHNPQLDVNNIKKVIIEEGYNIP